MTLASMLMAGASGLFLYQSKHQVQVLDREVGKVVKLTEQTRERIGILRAEWALLNEPDRISELARTRLGLTTLQPSQFVGLNELATRLSGSTSGPAPPQPA